MEIKSDSKNECSISRKQWIYICAEILIIVFLVFDISIGSFGIRSRICSRCGTTHIKKSFLSITYSSKTSPTEVTEWLYRYVKKEHKHNWLGTTSSSSGIFSRGMHGHGRGYKHHVYFEMLMNSDLSPTDKKELYDMLQSENREVIRGFIDKFFSKLEENGA